MASRILLMDMIGHEDAVEPLEMESDLSTL